MNQIYFEAKGEALLERIGMTKAEFARRMGIRKQNVKALFKSKNLETIYKAAGVMGVPFEMLIGYIEEPDLSDIPLEPYEDEDEVVVGSSSPQEPLENKILTIRNVPVILDDDIAQEYGVPTKRLNEQVKRNIDRFPPDFMFQLSQIEFNNLRSQIATTRWSMRRNAPYAFTELGVSMLSGVLTSERAIQASIRIIRAFVAMRRFMVANAQVFQRLDRIEYKQLVTDQKLEDIYSKLEEKLLKPEQGVFFDGQIYDAYNFICHLIKSSKSRIVLIDNYIDDTVLTMLDKRREGVVASVFTQKVSDQFKLDIEKHNKQYPAIDVKLFKKSHDRFLIIDNKVYLVGASLKDLGQKWFALALLSATNPNELISKLNAEATSN